MPFPARRHGRDFLAQHRLLKLAQFLTRLQPQLLGQHRPGAVVGRQRLRLTLAAIQRQHQQAPQSLADRMLGDQAFQLACHLRVPPQPEIGFHAAFQHDQPKLLQPRAFQREGFHVGHVRERTAAPQPQRLPEPASGDDRLTPAKRIPARPG